MPDRDQDILPLTQTLTPATPEELAAAIADALAREQAVYPVGGGTSLNYGITPTRPGVGLSLAGLDRIIDFPARDMTITVQAGVRMETLQRALAAERQWLPIDVPCMARATIGGVVATAFSGPRRFGQGTVRDFVIGIRAVDGRGRNFRGGGQVVKNVAGYDMCKLLTGSLGTLGVITEVSLKVKQLPEQSAFLITDLRDIHMAERLLAGLVRSATRPAAVELLLGPAWQEQHVLGLPSSGVIGRLAIGLEGTSDEVAWMLRQLDTEWRAAGAESTRGIEGEAAQQLWRDLAEFPVNPAPWVVKISVPPSHVTAICAMVTAFDPAASLLSHAGSGIVVARISATAVDVQRELISRWQPAAEREGGSVVVLSSTQEGLTRQTVWGGTTSASSWMEKVKREFDPRGILNPGRFVY